MVCLTLVLVTRLLALALLLLLLALLPLERRLHRHLGTEGGGGERSSGCHLSLTRLLLVHIVKGHTGHLLLLLLIRAK